MRARLAISTLLICAACSGGPDYGYAVAVTVKSNALADAARTAAHNLHFIVTGAETYDVTLATPSGLRGSERTVYRPVVGSGDLKFEVVALDGSNNALADGSATATLRAGKTVELTVELHAIAADADMAVGGDLASGDLPPGSDLSQDLAPTPDLTPAKVKLTIVLDGNGTGAVSANTGAIDCGTDCDELYDPGATVILTATPSGGSTRGPWTGCDAVTGGGSCSITINASRTVVASFIQGENCYDGIDNDGDSMIDCADPDCTVVSCVASAPATWKGPFAVLSGASATVGDACPGPFVGQAATKSWLTPSQSASCADCQCAGTVPAGPCDKVELRRFDTSDSACASTYLPTDVASGCNAGVTDAAHQARFVATSLGSNSCTGSPTGGGLTKDTVSWATTTLACATAETHVGGCTASQVCLPKVPSVPTCIEHDGDVTCPAGDYTQKSVFFKSSKENFSCEACNCHPTSWTCSGDVIVDVFAISDGSCATPLHTENIGPMSGAQSACFSLAASTKSFVRTSRSVASGVCAPDKVSPSLTGGVSGDDAAKVTYCCLP